MMFCKHLPCPAPFNMSCALVYVWQTISNSSLDFKLAFAKNTCLVTSFSFQLAFKIAIVEAIRDSFQPKL